jgi:hypothetical protein
MVFQDGGQPYIFAPVKDRRIVYYMGPTKSGLSGPEGKKSLEGFARKAFLNPEVQKPI